MENASQVLFGDCVARTSFNCCDEAKVRFGRIRLDPDSIAKYLCSPFVFTQCKCLARKIEVGSEMIRVCSKCLAEVKLALSEYFDLR